MDSSVSLAMSRFVSSDCLRLFLGSLRYISRLLISYFSWAVILWIYIFCGSPCWGRPLTQLFLGGRIRPPNVLTGIRLIIPHGYRIMEAFVEEGPTCFRVVGKSSRIITLLLNVLITDKQLRILFFKQHHLIRLYSFLYLNRCPSLRTIQAIPLDVFVDDESLTS